MNGTQEKTKKSLMDRFLNVIERAGNKLPDPVSLFVLLAIVVIVLSAVLGAAGVSATHPGTGKVIKIVNLLSVDGFRMMWSKAVSNFANFAPLAMVLVCVIGSGVAEKSGFLAAFMQKMLGDAAPAVVTFVIHLHWHQRQRGRGCGLCGAPSGGRGDLPEHGPASAVGGVLRVRQCGGRVLRQCNAGDE